MQSNEAQFQLLPMSWRGEIEKNKKELTQDSSLSNWNSKEAKRDKMKA